MSWYIVRFKMLEGWFISPRRFERKEDAISFALEYADSHMNIIDFDVVRR